MNTEWNVGQTAIINRQQIVTVERVTSSGRAVAGGRTFDVDGTERAGGDRFRRARLEPLTPEIQAEIDLVDRGRKASNKAAAAVSAAEKWLQQSFGSWGRRVPEAEDVEMAERLAAAIGSIMGIQPETTS